jgi:Prokaryotic cytochrome b561
MAHRQSAARAPSGRKALGTAARACSTPRLLRPHRGDDRIGLADGLGIAAAASRPPSRGFVVPNLTGPNALLKARTKFIHKVVSKLLIAAIGLHVAAALKHHFVDKDTILLRMLPFQHDDRRP